MKKIILLVLIFFSVNAFSQMYLNISGINERVINDYEEILQPGLGASVGLFVPVGSKSYNIGKGENYLTFNGEAMNYPHIGEKYLFRLNDGIDNSFNYMHFSIGYRHSLRFPEANGRFSYYRHWNRIDGLSFEPRLGIIMFDINREQINPAVSFSYRLMYSLKSVQMSVYGQYAEAKKNMNFGYIKMLSVGVTIGYNIKLF